MSDSLKLNSDIYSINEYVNKIKKDFTPGVNEDTLMLGIFGYTGQVFSDMIQNTIVMASEFSNESIPTKAKFEKNIIAHALGLGITDINAIPAQFDVLLTLVEDDISKWAEPTRFSKGEEFAWEFIFDKDTPIYIGEYEFHTDYDIKIRKVKVLNTGKKDKFSYTAQYIIDVDNPISEITNPYLTSPAKMNVNGTNVLFTKCTLHQVERQKIYKKVLSDSSISAKTTTFEFDGQLAAFTIDVNEGGNTTHLIPVYDGLDVEDRKYPHFYYSYLDSNTIRIKFDRNSYAPRINSDVTIDLQTTQGESGNFDYNPTSYPSFAFGSEKYGYANIGCEIRPVTGESSGGTDKKSIDDLHKLIPKEALSRGSITNLTDLENFFNMLNTDQSKLYFYKKRDNTLERLYYSYILMRDAYNVIIPTNTINIEVPEENVEESTKQVIKKGQEFYLVKGDIILPSDETCDPKDPATMPEAVEGAYTDINGEWYIFKDGEWKAVIDSYKPNSRDRGVLIESVTTSCPYCGISMKASDLINHILEKHSAELFKDKNIDNMSNDEKYKFAKSTIYDNLGFVYQIPYNFVINASPLYGMYFLSTIDANKFLDFTYISDKCLYQYISTSINWFRGYNTNPNTYEMDIQVLQNITDNEINTNTTVGKMNTGTTLELVAVFYDENGNPLRWSKGNLVEGTDMSTGIYQYKFAFTTDDEIDTHNRIKINTGMYDIGTSLDNTIDSYAYFKGNTKCVIYALTQQGAGENGLGYGLEGLDEVVSNLIPIREFVSTSSNINIFDFVNSIPTEASVGDLLLINDTVYSYTDISLNQDDLYDKWVELEKIKIKVGDHAIIADTIYEYTAEEKWVESAKELQPYSVSNIYTVHEGIDFFYDYSEIINSVVDNEKVSETENIFTIEDVPVIKYDYFTDDGKAIDFCNELVKRKNYIDYAIQILEDAFGMDFKFFNTYGPSKLFTIDNAFNYLNRVNMSLKFRLKLRKNYDTNVTNDIIQDIKTYIEDINSINTIHMSNLVAEIYSKYMDSIEFFEFVNFNGYGADVKHLYSMGMPEEVIVPEFVNVDTKEDGTPDITLELV